MAMPVFKPPAFLAEQDAETIHRRMLGMLPADVDSSMGGFPWDFTRPTANEKAELLEFHLVETLKIMFPAWAYGEWLDRHAQGRGLLRRPPNHASGAVQITGTLGITIPAGFRVAVPAVGDMLAIEYQTMERNIIGTSGTVQAQIVAVEGGTASNITAGAISIMMEPISGITSVTNPTPVTGGTNEETDDELRLRINEMDAAGTMSFIGSDSDYMRWAKEVPGVGAALVQPEWAGAGTVKVIVLDGTGHPANETILAAVRDNIIPAADRLRRKAPIGATVSIEAPVSRIINYAFTLILGVGESQATVTDRFAVSLRTYYIDAKQEGVVRYTRIASLLAMTPGVADFSALTMNGAIANIAIAANEYPVTGTIAVTLGGGA